MSSPELAMADDGDIDMQEQIVTDVSPSKVSQDLDTEQFKIGPDNCADTNLDEQRASNANCTQVSVSRFKKRQKRSHRYQTQDLIREISPQPLEQKPIISDENFDAESQSDKLEKSQEGKSQSDEDGTKKPIEPLVLMINGKRMVKCNICKKQMTESRLANHIRLLHVERKEDENSPKEARKEFKCEHCGKSYALKYTYEQHIKTHTEGRPKCPECGSTFATAFSLFRHRAKVHNLKHNYTTHSCDQCDKSFFSMSELSLHKRRHSAEKDFKCPECDKGFAVKGNLRIHMRTHAKEKLYKCDICDNSFSHPYSLVSHRRIHTNEFPFKCEECGKNYRSKHQLTSHMMVHTNERPFKCNQCSKTFRSRTAFKMHQDHHEGIKRFTCVFCDRKFQCHANKLKHERRHIGDKRHQCEKCNKGFIEKQELKNHLKIHEKNETSLKSNLSNKDSKRVIASKIDHETEV